MEPPMLTTFDYIESGLVATLMKPFTAVVRDYESAGEYRRTNYFTLLCAGSEPITLVIYEQNLEEFKALIGSTITIRNFAIKGPKQEQGPLMLEYTRHSDVTTHEDSPPLSDATPYLKNNDICTSVLRFTGFQFGGEAGEERLILYCSDADERDVPFTAYNYDGAHNTNQRLLLSVPPSWSRSEDERIHRDLLKLLRG
uniref:DUF4708 domain-containing protein n=1 Tax=Steinernema glaseri TaxID=37863 RepID=A0A1I7YIR9_9BILA